MSLLVAMLLAVPPPPATPLQRVTVCYQDGGGCMGLTYPLTDTQLRASPVPMSLASVPTHAVTGTFWQATQPVSGTLTCNAGSGTLAVSLASVPSHAVTGTFWQATQPISGTVTTAPPSNATTNVTQLGGTDVSKGAGVATAGSLRVVQASDSTVAVTGTFWQATQPVSGTVAATQSGTWSNRVTDGTDTAQVTTTGGGALAVECVAGCGAPAAAVTYTWITPDVVAGADKLYGDLFNAAGSGKIIKVVGIYPIIKGDVAVTGAVAIRFDWYRTSAVGTGGTAAPYKSATRDVAGGNISPRDTANAALPAQITARWLPTGGATISEWMDRGQCFTEETNAATFICSGQTNMLDTGGWSSQALVLREGQGLLLKQGSVASVNNIAFHVVFNVE